MIKVTGFSLIELMVAIAIVGILAAIAYPSYTQYVAQGARSEGIVTLMRIANLQEQYYLDNRSYTADLTQLGFNASPYITEHDYYSIASTGGSTFTATATAQGVQASRDGACATLTLSDNGTKSPTECW